MKLEPVVSAAVLGSRIDWFAKLPPARATTVLLSLTGSCDAGETRARLFWLTAELLLGTTSGEPRHSEHEGCGRNGTVLLDRFSLREEDRAAPLMKWPHSTQHNVRTSLDRHEPSRGNVESGEVHRRCLTETELLHRSDRPDRSRSSDSQRRLLLGALG